MRQEAKTAGNMRRAAPVSFSLLVSLPVISAAGYFAARLYFYQSLFSLWPCAFRELTGLYCPACGSTRAVGALMRFSVMESLRYNPVPVLAAALLFFIWCRALVNVAVFRRERSYRFFFAPFYGILAVSLVLCVARNLAAL